MLPHCFSQPVCRLLSTLMTLGLTFAWVAAPGQTSPSAQVAASSVTPPAPYPDWQSFLAAAANANGLVGKDMTPWHLKAKFKLYDEQHKVKEEGAFEAYVASPTKLRASIVSKSFTQSIYRTDRSDHAVFVSGPDRMPGGFSGQPWPLDQLWAAFADPLPHPGLMPQVMFDGKEFTTSAKKALCVQARGRPALATDMQSPVYAFYCFEPGTQSLLFTSSPVGANGTLITRVGQKDFQGHSIPKQVFIAHGNNIGLIADLESIETIGNVDARELAPPADAQLYPTMMAPPGGVPFFGPSVPVTAANGSGIPKQVTISEGVAQGMVLKKIPPTYPPIAKAARIEGTVVLQATISKQGEIEDLKVISGHPMLQQSALDAVKQWTYKPYQLNGEPVEVATTVNVVFQLDPSANPPKKVTIAGGIAQGHLIHPVAPIYPSEAKKAKVSGLVVLQATIGKAVHIEDLRVVSGHPMLQQAAIDAVKQWTYEPYLLNGEPVAVETTINVVFNLGSAPKQP